MYEITSALLKVLPSNKTKTPNGWTSFTAPCCIYNGETQDKKKRGGIIVGPEGGISYHCFNCQYTTGWKPGRPLSYKMRKLMEWMGVPVSEIQRLIIDALRVRDEEGIITESFEDEVDVSFEPRSLPGDTFTIQFGFPYMTQAEKLANYIRSRGIPEIYFGRFSGSLGKNLRNKLIIPFTYNSVNVGHTMRSINGVGPKYVMSSQPNYVFNLDRIKPEYKYTLVTEGPIDAILCHGVAVLSNSITDTQASLIESLGKEVVLVPDRNKSGQKLIDQAIKYGWSVSFPSWGDPNVITDVNDAVKEYGSIFTMKTILDNIESSALKIELRRRKFE